MKLRNVLMFKIEIRDTANNTNMPVDSFKKLFDEVFNEKCRNNSMTLTERDQDPMVLDIIENTEEYLFGRLNKKRPNFSIQKRNYDTLAITDILSPDEVNSNGVELFTYFILGYHHGILSIVDSKGAPNEKALGRIFAIHNSQFQYEAYPIPNRHLLSNLIDGKAPVINKIRVDIARPSAQILQQLFGFGEEEVIQTVQQNTASMVFEVKPQLRGALTNNTKFIGRLVQAFQDNHDKYKSVILTGKKDDGDRQRRYDLYEEYFKYPITVEEYKKEGGREVERDRIHIQNQYRDKMKLAYDEYKKMILAVSDR